MKEGLKTREGECECEEISMVVEKDWVRGEGEGEWCGKERWGGWGGESGGGKESERKRFCLFVWPCLPDELFIRNNIKRSKKEKENEKEIWLERMSMVMHLKLDERPLCDENLALSYVKLTKLWKFRIFIMLFSHYRNSIIILISSST